MKTPLRWLASIWLWFDDRTGIGGLIGPFLQHPVPRSTASGKWSWMYIFGVATLSAFILQVVTGIALATLYIPSSSDAYSSLQFITHQAFLGSLLRGTHYFGASAMILFIGIHMIRVFLTGSYKFPREVNWLSGSALLLLTLLMAFTGQSLKWDENGYWSLTIAAEQAGRVPFIGTFMARFVFAGREIGASTLVRIFAFHVFFIPAVIFLVVGLHLWLVLRNGISEPPESGRPVDPGKYRAWYQDLLKRDGVPYFPEAMWHEAAFGVLVVLVVLLLGLIAGPPGLTQAPSPSIVHVEPRPDWYFLWYYGVLALLRPWIEDYVIVLVPIVIAIFFIFLPFVRNRGERSPRRRPWAVAGVIILALYVVVTWQYGRVAPWSPRFNAQPLSAQQIGSNSPAIRRGAQIFYDKGCEYCHEIDGQGGIRGPNLTDIGSRLTGGQIAAVIDQGPGGNMPSYLEIITPSEMKDLVAFLSTRTGPNGVPAH